MWVPCRQPSKKQKRDRQVMPSNAPQWAAEIDSNGGFIVSTTPSNQFSMFPMKSLIFPGENEAAQRNYAKFMRGWL